MSNLLTNVLGIQSPFIVVVGDLMLDEIISGDAERLSPDSPVPVLEVKSTSSHAGGAGNVARCLRALGAQVHCLGVIGEDEEGTRLLELLENEQISTANILRCPDRVTTVKRSLVGLAQHRHPQKMFRLDRETKANLEQNHANTLIQSLGELLPKTDVVCIEDYGKGVISEKTCKIIIEHCREAGVEVLVDPAGIDDYSKYKGATAITPNRSEAEKATGIRLDVGDMLQGAASLAAKLCESLNMHAAILTLDKHGALLQERDKEPEHFPTRARSVYDVTGAGDMVLAAIAMGRGGGLDWGQCVELANVAAGLEVEVFGATPIPIASIHHELLQLRAKGFGKIRSNAELRIELDAMRETGKRIALTNGCFDVIHAGHVSYLREAASLADILIVGVNSDEQVKLQKGEDRPIYSLSERMEILAELQCVSLVTSFTEPTADNLISLVRPHVYVKGGDYQPHEINETVLLKELGVEVAVVAERPGLSSTNVVAKMRSDS